MSNALPRHLRTNSTDAEQHLWRLLRNRQLAGHKFRRQHPIPPYIVDFICLEHRLIIELDGGQHADAVAYDEARTNYLESQDYRILRFWNHEVLSNTDGMLTIIHEALNTKASP